MLALNLALSAVLSSSPIPRPAPVPEGPGLYFADVGQGSALLIHEPAGGVIAIDSGPSSGAEALLNALSPSPSPHVDLWIHTHWDADHVGGFARVSAGLDGAYPSPDDPTVDRLWDRGFAAAPLTDAVMLYALLAGERRVDVSAGAEMLLGDAHVRAIAFDHGPASEENARGLALCVTLPGLRLLAPGDLPVASVEAAASGCEDVDVLWASHHGAIDGISSPLLERVNPRVVVVSAGRENAYCHPQPATLALLQDREVWITHASGLGPGGPCEPIAGVLGPKHHIAGGGIWLPLDAR